MRIHSDSGCLQLRVHLIYGIDELPNVPIPDILSTLILHQRDLRRLHEAFPEDPGDLSEGPPAIPGGTIFSTHHRLLQRFLSPLRDLHDVFVRPFQVPFDAEPADPEPPPIYLDFNRVALRDHPKPVVQEQTSLKDERGTNSI